MFSANDKLYTCSECQKGFRSEHNLREHLRTHTGERPYKCRICDKTFRTSGTRCRHERSHEGSHDFLRKPAKPVAERKAFACTRCAEHFSSGVTRSKHMKRFHGLSGQYFCLQCNLELSSVEDLVRHHSSEHSSEFGIQATNQGSLLTDEHQDHAYHRPPLNNVNVNNSKSLAEKESHANISPYVVEYPSEHQKQSLTGLGYVKIPVKQKNLCPADRFACKYYERGFSKLPALLKHLLTHSEEDLEVEIEPSIVKNESFADGSDVVVENTTADIGQTVMMSCRSSPVLVEVKNECESEALYLSELEVSPDVKRDLQHLVDEFALRKLDSTTQDHEQNSAEQTEDLPLAGTLRKRTNQDKRKKRLRKKSDQCLLFTDSENSVCDGLRVSDICDIKDLLEKGSNKTVSARVQCVNGVQCNLEDGSISPLKRSNCILDRNRNRVSCDDCGGELNNSDDGRYSCNSCSESFKNVHPNAPTTLSVNNTKTTYSLRRISSSKTDSSEKSYSCKHCKAKFKTKKQYRLHKKTHTSPGAPKPLEALELKSCADKEPFSCSVCGRRFAFKYRLHRHMIIHTGEKPFMCNECGKSFTTNAYLKSHAARHTNELAYLCSTCGKRFADRIAWRYHKRVHDLAQRTDNHAIKEHTCWVCGHQFNRASNLARHVLKHQSGDKLQYGCDECDRRFRTKEGYRYHVGQHAPDKPYLCMDCPKAFADAFCLKTHLKSHAQQGSFECGVCGKKYRTMFILRMHARYHTEMRYSCNVCGETFGFARQFRSHLIKHRPPFHCDVCGVTTTRATDLRKHKKRFQH